MEPPPHESKNAAPGGPGQGEGRISFDELARISGLSPMRLARLVQRGVLEPLTPDATEYSVQAALRVKRMLRLRADLGVGLFSAAIIVDLLERLDLLE